MQVNYKQGMVFKKDKSLFINPCDDCSFYDMTRVKIQLDKYNVGNVWLQF
jgi:hypothetical protein